MLARLSEALSQLAAASSAQAAASAPSTQEWRETKYVKAPEIFNPKSIEEEISMWPEWAFSFKNFMAVQDDEYRGDFAKAETSTEFLAFEDYGPGGPCNQSEIAAAVLHPCILFQRASIKNSSCRTKRRRI